MPASAPKPDRLSAPAITALIRDADRVAAMDSHDSPVTLILNFEERAEVHLASPELARADVAQTANGFVADCVLVRKFQPFLVFGEATAIADVEVKAGHLRKSVDLLKAQTHCRRGTPQEFFSQNDAGRGKS